jgi:hypothetical protein
MDSLRTQFKADLGSSILPDYVKVATISQQVNTDPLHSLFTSEHSPFLVFDPDQNSQLKFLICKTNISESPNNCTLPLPYSNTLMNADTFFQKVIEPENDLGNFVSE